MAKRVCFVTLSRSDYASLRPVIRAAANDPDIDARVVAGGSHLLRRFGHSIEQVRADGIEIDRVVDFLGENDDSDVDFARAHARACAGFVEYFHDSAPQSVFILGDRWEMLAVASAASLLRIPIVHHSGGDITQGSMDNQTRYALTALAHLHLVALEQHRRRLLAIGEQDWRVFTVGEPALTEIAADDGVDPRADLGLAPGAPFALATFHPTSFDALDFAAQAAFFVDLLETIEIDVVLTAPNPDPGSDTVYRALRRYAQSRALVHWFENLGAARYRAAMRAADFMIGNSSSGIWEAPSFGLPAINIGLRQQDRLRGANVIDVDYDLSRVTAAIADVERVRSLSEVRARQNPYVRDDTLNAILDAIKLPRSHDELLAKRLVDPLGG